MVYAANKKIRCGKSHASRLMIMGLTSRVLMTTNTFNYHQRQFA